MGSCECAITLCGEGTRKDNSRPFISLSGGEEPPWCGISAIMFGREGETLCCPWHGWEFENHRWPLHLQPHRTHVRYYDATVDPADPSIETYPVAAHPCGWFGTPPYLIVVEN